MRILQINALYGSGSTGKIVKELHEYLQSKGANSYVAFSFGKRIKSNNVFKFTNLFETKISSLFAHFFGNYGFENFLATNKLIRFIKRVRPDIVHIHNIHSHDCDFKKLFNYLSGQNIRVVYSFHDCWALTGYCPHFEFACCEKWQKKCYGCPLYKQFSFFLDKSTQNHNKKIASLLNCEKLYLIAPSLWMSNVIGASFLKNKKTALIYNGVDLMVFKPTYGNTFNNIDRSKIIVLGVAFNFNVLKGIDDFVSLANMLSNKYLLVLVGNISDEVTVPENVITISKTNNKKELAELYTLADVYVNLTKQETSPLTNLESLACGTPVITYNSGGSPETIDDQTGIIVEKNNVKKVVEAIERFGKKDKTLSEKCLLRSKHFDKTNMNKHIYDFYTEILKD